MGELNRFYEPILSIWAMSSGGSSRFIAAALLRALSGRLAPGMRIITGDLAKSQIKATW